MKYYIDIPDSSRFSQQYWTHVDVPRVLSAQCARVRALQVS